MTDMTLTGIVLDENTELSLSDLCDACSRDTAWVSALVEEGVLEPINAGGRRWRFTAISLQRAHTAMRLERDLGVNVAGIALAIDLLDEVRTLRARLRDIEGATGNS